jgi:hypothetical protein
MVKHKRQNSIIGFALVFTLFSMLPIAKGQAQNEGVPDSLFSFLVSTERSQANGLTDSLRRDVLEVQTRPAGAIVEIKGLYKFTGKTPFVLPQKIRGLYKIKTRLAGYESVDKTMDFVDVGQQQVIIRLPKKTRLKAAGRSLLIPGWGQAYGGSKFHAVLISSIQMGLGIVSLRAQMDYTDEQEDLDLALDNFRLSNSLEDLIAYQSAFRDTKDAYDWRNRVLLVTAGFWLYNVLDSMIFFSARSSVSIKSSAISQNGTGDDLMLSLNIKL